MMRMRHAACLVAALLMSATALLAQTPYEQDMRLGRLFEQCGNLLMAEQHYTSAAAHAASEEQQLHAQLSLVQAIALRRPVEAARLNESIRHACHRYPQLMQQHIALYGFISFRLKNTVDFERANEAYLHLCQETDQLPTTYDLALQAMGEALGGYPDEALATIARDEQLPPVMRHDLRCIIFTMSERTQALIDELKQRAVTIDSLQGAFYSQIAAEMQATGTLKTAHQAARRAHVRHLVTVGAMALLLALMAALLLWLWHHHRQRMAQKNEQLRTALKMASETDTMKREFVRRVSHEIRTPLNAITGFNDVLNNDQIDLSPEERSELLGRIAENVKAITTIVDELLQAANAESVVDYAKNDEVRCNQFFSDLLYRHSADVGASVQLRYTTRVVNRLTILTNAETVGNIVEHLIHNAIKFTQRGTIELNCRQEHGRLLLTVTDTGCGIPQEKQDEVFEQFTKVDAFQQGIGLGLAVSRQTARKLGGDLELDKTYTGGARFVLTLPCK